MKYELKEGGESIVYKEEISLENSIKEKHRKLYDFLLERIDHADEEVLQKRYKIYHIQERKRNNKTLKRKFLNEQSKEEKVGFDEYVKDNAKNIQLGVPEIVILKPVDILEQKQEQYVNPNRMVLKLNKNSMETQEQNNSHSDLNLSDDSPMKQNENNDQSSLQLSIPDAPNSNLPLAEILARKIKDPIIADDHTPFERSYKAIVEKIFDCRFKQMGLMDDSNKISNQERTRLLKLRQRLYEIRITNPCVVRTESLLKELLQHSVLKGLCSSSDMQQLRHIERYFVKRQLEQDTLLANSNEQQNKREKQEKQQENRTRMTRLDCVKQMNETVRGASLSQLDNINETKIEREQTQETKECEGAKDPNDNLISQRSFSANFKPSKVPSLAQNYISGMANTRDNTQCHSMANTQNLLNILSNSNTPIQSQNKLKQPVLKQKEQQPKFDLSHLYLQKDSSEILIKKDKKETKQAKHVNDLKMHIMKIQKNLYKKSNVKFYQLSQHKMDQEFTFVYNDLEKIALKNTQLSFDSASKNSTPHQNNVQK